MLLLCMMQSVFKLNVAFCLLFMLCVVAPFTPLLAGPEGPGVLTL
jgi:hypothetical protein